MTLMWLIFLPSGALLLQAMQYTHTQDQIYNAENSTLSWQQKQLASLQRNKQTSELTTRWQQRSSVLPVVMQV